MKNTNEILSRISNLISDDSSILKEFERKIEESVSNKTKAEEERRNFELNIKSIQSDIDDITRASELRERFDNIDVYIPGLEKLGEAVSLINKLKEELKSIPSHIEELENRIKELTDKCDDSSKVIKDAEDRLSNLDVELSDAKRYQANLVELINLAKSGDINKTRDEVVETLIHVGFNQSEALSAAKIILFPEDDLIPYFNAGKKDEEKPSFEETSPNEIELDSIKVKEEEEVETKEQPVEVKTEEEIAEEIVLDTKINDLLTANNIDLGKLSDEELSVLNSSDYNLINDNIELLKSNAIGEDFIYKYPGVLIDINLKDKFNFIVDKLGKTKDDIRLTPDILVSYSYDDLKKLVSILEDNNIKASLIPLNAYVKGLQAFINNYQLLMQYNIVLDDMDFAKNLSILNIDEESFRDTLQVIIDYDVNLVKNDGKYAISLLTIPAIELAEKIDLIISIEEEDLLKYYPEVLLKDGVELANRLIFVKKSGIPYKNTSNGKVVYQPFALDQEVLNKVVERELELHEIDDVNNTNNDIVSVIKDSTLVDELKNMNVYVEIEDKARELLSTLNVEEDEYKIVIGDYVLSKNSTLRNLSILLNKFDESTYSKELLLLTSLFYNSRLEVEEMNEIINILGIEVK